MNKLGLLNYLSSNGKDKTWAELSAMYGFSNPETARNIWLRYRKANNNIKKTETIIQLEESALYQEFISWKQNLLNEVTSKSLLPYTKGNINNVLVIGDLYLPFELTDYICFIRETQEKYNCGKIIFIGDLLDNHVSSFYTSDSEAYGAKTELELATNKLKEWYRLFPEAIVISGNHDRIISRKMTEGNLTSRWMRGYAEVLEVPTWEFVDEYIYNNVLYIHGEGQTAIQEVNKKFISVVQGHRHTELYVQYTQNPTGTYFGMQVGTGIDKNKYAFNYAKNHAQPLLGCGVIIENQGFVIPYIK